MIYEWDEAKRAVNLDKHGLDFADADLVLESEFVRIVDSPRGSETRSLCVRGADGAVSGFCAAWRALSQHPLSSSPT